MAWVAAAALTVGLVCAPAGSSPRPPVVHVGGYSTVSFTRSPDHVTFTINRTPAVGFFVAYQTRLDGHTAYFGIQHGLALASVFSDSASAVASPAGTIDANQEMGDHFVSVHDTNLSTGSHRLVLDRDGLDAWRFSVDGQKVGWLIVPGHGGTGCRGWGWVEYMPNTSRTGHLLPVPSFRYSVTVAGHPFTVA